MESIRASRLNRSPSRNVLAMEAFSLDARIDSTNALNHPTFSSWNTTISSAQFGFLNAANPMRNLQTTLRLRF